MTDVIDGTELGPVGQEIVYENDRVRVWHIRLEPGERQPLHRHDHPYLVVAIEGAKNVVQTVDGGPHHPVSPVQRPGRVPDQIAELARQVRDDDVTRM